MNHALMPLYERPGPCTQHIQFADPIGNRFLEIRRNSLCENWKSFRFPTDVHHQDLFTDNEATAIIAELIFLLIIV